MKILAFVKKVISAPIYLIKKGGSKTRSIRTKLIAAFSLTIIPIFLLGMVSFFTSRQSLKSVAVDSSLSTLQQSNNYLNMALTNVDDLSLQIMSNEKIQEYLNFRVTEENNFEYFTLRSDVDSYIGSLTNGSKLVNNITFIKEDQVSGNANKYLNHETLTFEKLKENNNYAKVFENAGRATWFTRHSDLDAIPDNPTYAMSLMRIINSTSNGDSKGIVIIDVRKEIVDNLLKSISLGSTSQIHLVGPDGIDLISLPADKDGNTGDNVPETAAPDSEISSITSEEFYKSILATNEISGSEDVTFDGKPCLMEFNKIGETGFVLVGLIPTSELYTASNRILTITIFLIILAAVVSILMGVIMSTSMGRTINRIIKVAGQAASGDLTVNPTSRRKDELGTLTKSINSMITSMRDLIKQAATISATVDSSASTVASTSEQVASVSQEISRAIQEISQGATSQAADAEQGSQKMNELAAKINIVSENANAIVDFSKGTMSLTQKGLSTVSELEQRAQETTNITNAIIEDIKLLDSNSKSINKIISTISGIADQTNLLALNAAIEAARAGEAGRGFAVVADEVRKLAEQSMDATNEIVSIINDTQSQTAKAVEKAETSGGILKLQNESLQNTIEVFNNISRSMEQLAEKVEDSIKAISEMDNFKVQTVSVIENISAVSQQTAASSEEVTASTEEQLSSIQELAAYAQQLSDAAKNLNDSISKFKV